MVVPKHLIDRFVAMRAAISIYPPYLTQAVLTDFINQGHLSRHIRRTRLLYAKRRARLTQCLEGESGMNLVVMLPAAARDVELARRAAARGLWLWPLSPYYLHTPHKGFVLGFGNVPVSEMPAAVCRMSQVLRGALGVRAAESSLTE